ncbi:MAG: TIGR03643 family protein [Cryomorphaceae bacterium]|nr:TIGR03643 family protein [Flavobacteriales bacterium]
MEKSKKIVKNLTERETDRIIEMAWEDRTPFEAIEMQFGLAEKHVIALMRREMKASSFRMWRKRVTDRPTKHKAKSAVDDGRFKSAAQRHITGNKITKR